MRSGRALCAMAIAAGGLVASASSAGATTCFIGYCVGGEVKVRGSSSVSVTSNWNTKAYRNVPPGGTSKSYFFDADGFYVPSGCDIQEWGYSYKEGYWYRATRHTATGWVKIVDTTEVMVSKEC